MADVSNRRAVDIRRQAGFGFIAVVCVMVLYLPILVIITYSFNSAASLGADWRGFSLNWYGAVLNNKSFYDAAWLSIVIAVTATAIATVIATAAALGTSRVRPWRGQRASVLAINSPLIIPEIVIAIALLSFFSFVANLLNMDLGVAKLIAAHTAFCIPFAYLPIRARLDGMDLTLENAAADLYANRLQAFRYVTLPLLVPGISSGAALAFIASFDDFIITQLVAGPGQTTLPLYIFAQIRFALTPELNAMCTLLIVVSMAFVILSYLLTRKNKRQ